MKIDLDEHIRNNRSKLDEIEDLNVDQMWESFEGKIKPKRNYWWIFLAFILLLVITVLFSIPRSLSQDELVHQTLMQSNPALAAQQISMIEMINEQGRLINEMGINEKQFPELFEELDVLDSLQYEAIDDLDNLRDRKNLLRSLVRHYERKARILELMLYEFEKQENESAYENAKQM